MRAQLLFLCFLMSGFFSYSQEKGFYFDDIYRTYRIYVPDNLDPDSSYSLIINMHGLGSNAYEQQLYTLFDPIADTARFIISYPNAVNAEWNVTNDPNKADDVGFISALIDTIAAEYPVNHKRVYATGMSMGGFMSYRLACNLSGRIAAMASVTGLSINYGCQPVHPMPIIQMHGTADDVVPYAGVDATLPFWIDLNGCPATPVVTDLPDIDTNDFSTVTKSVWGLCEDSVEVILYTINGGEHTWPGAKFLIGITNQDINASLEIWNFFKKYSLPSPAAIAEKPFAGISISVYPNPVLNTSMVSLGMEPGVKFTYRLADNTGRILKAGQGSQSNYFLLEKDNLPPGIYHLSVISSVYYGQAKVIIR